MKKTMKRYAHLTYAVMAIEMSHSTGTPYIEWCITLRKSHNVSAIKKLLKGSEVEIPKDLQEARNKPIYGTKDNPKNPNIVKYVIFDDRKQGKRTDINDKSHKDTVFKK